MLPRAVSDIIRQRWTPAESGRSPQLFRFFTSQLNTANESSLPEIGSTPIRQQSVTVKSVSLVMLRGFLFQLDFCSPRNRFRAIDP
jgi:hypothetical protein